MHVGLEAYHHYKWYNSMLAYELKANVENSKLKVVHWHIESGNTDAFMMNGKIYKSVSIIIGESMEHWYCWNRAGDKSFGSRYRKIEEKENDGNKRLAIFTIDDYFVKDEANLRCTSEVCANNCLPCKKFKSPFKNSNKNCCACFPSSINFKAIEEESDIEGEDSDDEDIAQITQIPHVKKRTNIFNIHLKLKAPTNNEIV
jgi:hypothetical protein